MIPACARSIAAPPRRSARRRGSIYLVSTSGLVLVAGVGLAAMGLLRADRITHLNIHETSDLRRIAQSGLELAVQRIADDPNWRGTVDPAIGWTWSLAGADITVQPSDPIDNNLANNPFDDVVLTAWATRGDARQGARVRLEMLEDGGPVLDFSLAATHQIRLSASANLRASAAIYTRTDFVAGGSSSVTADVFAAGTITTSGGSQIHGSARPNAPLVNFPDPDRAFAAWIAQATTIRVSDLESDHRLTNVTLSPTENPFGDPNPDGIYHIHGIKQELIIDSVNITGTLIVTQAESGIRINNEFHGAAANPASPVLMFQGETRLTNASERFNINGMVFVQGDMRIETNARFQGPLIVLGNCRISGATVRIAPTGAVAAAPPVGFSTHAAPAILDRSWRRAID